MKYFKSRLLSTTLASIVLASTAVYAGVIPIPAGVVPNRQTIVISDAIVSPDGFERP